MSRSTGSSSFSSYIAELEPSNRRIATAVNELTNIIDQDLDHVLQHPELVDDFNKYVTNLQQQSSNLTVRHYGLLTSVRMLANLLKYDHPAIKFHANLMAETVDKSDFNNAWLIFIKYELAEKHGKVKEYLEEQHAINQEIATSEEQNSLLEEKKLKLADAIRCETEAIANLMKERRKTIFKKIVYFKKLKRLNDLAELMELKMNNIREAWTNIRYFIHRI